MIFASIASNKTRWSIKMFESVNSSIETFVGPYSENHFIWGAFLSDWKKIKKKKNTIFGLKLVMKSGLDFFLFWNPSMR